MRYQVAPKFQWLPWWTEKQEWYYGGDQPSGQDVHDFAYISNYAGWLWWQFHWYS